MNAFFNTLQNYLLHASNTGTPTGNREVGLSTRNKKKRLVKKNDVIYQSYINDKGSVSSDKRSVKIQFSIEIQMKFKGCLGKCKS